MFDGGVSCPHVRRNSNRTNREAKEVIRSPHWRMRFRLKHLQSPNGGKKGAGAVLKIGDRFKDKATGKIYVIKVEFDNETLFLEGENGLGRRLTGKESLRRTCEKLDDITS